MWVWAPLGTVCVKGTTAAAGVCTLLPWGLHEQSDMTPLSGSEAKVQSKGAKFALHEVLHERESTLARVIGGQRVRMVLGFEK